MTETKTNYKATFILDTRGREESPEDLVNGLKAELEEVGAEVSSVEELGKQDFARAADQRYIAGTYAQYFFAGDSNVTDRILEKLRLNKLVSHKMIQKI